MPQAAPGQLAPDRAFVVQFRDMTSGAGEAFSGRAEHISSGHAVCFESIEELHAFLVDRLSALPTKRSDQG